MFEATLYIVQLGGRTKASLFEQHVVFACIGATPDDMIAACRHHPSGLDKRHIDGWLEIALSRTDVASDAHLFLVETGFDGALFTEGHGYSLIRAGSMLAARHLAREGASGLHIDSIVDLSRIAGKAGYAICAQTPVDDLCRTTHRYIPLD